MTATFAFRRRRLGARRGSTILLVISVLSLLVLLAVGMAFTSRIEMSTASNFGDGVQNRVAAITGVSSVSAKALQTLPKGAIGPLDLSLEEDFLAARDGRPSDSDFLRDRIAAGAVSFSPIETAATADVGLIDASARINVNAADAEMLARFFDLAGDELGLAIDARAAANAIADVRLGPDGAPGRKGVDDDADSDERLVDDLAADGVDRTRSASEIRSGVAAPADSAVIDDLAETRAPRRARADAERIAARRALLTGIDEADEYVADIRLEAHGDDVRFGSLRDLLSHDAITAAGLDEAALDSLEPLMTVFSASIDQRMVDGEPAALVDINRATPEEIFQALSDLYGEGKNPDLLRQFALNIVDARDGDSVPTAWAGEQGALLGVERAPLITEVYPDSITAEDRGDDGQFVEIFNPWSEDISVDGWRLEGSGGVVALRGKIAAQGYLVVTDDVDNRLDPTASDDLPGTGSLYDIFGALPDNGRNRAVESPNFALPDAGDVEVRLVDADGNAVDVFAFRVRKDQLDELYSYQRENPLIRASLKRRATLFAQPARVTEPGAEEMARLANYPPDGPFASAVDVMDVFAGFSERDNPSNTVSWGFPVVGTLESADARTADLAAHPSTIDGRVLDIFGVEYRDYPDSPAPTAEDDMGLFVADVPTEWALGLRPGVRHGRVNLNTAPAVVLGSLPGTTPAGARRVAQRRDLLVREVRDGQGGDGVLYAVPSDVLVDDDLLGAPKSGPERLGRFRSLWERAALNSRAFVLVGQPRAGADANNGQRMATRVASLVALDRGRAEHVAGWNLHQ